MSNLVTLWTVFGALVMGSFENWSFTRGIYFALVTMTTIRFGDYAPSSNYARGFNIFYASVGVIMVGTLGLVTMAYFISVATELFSCLIDTHSDRVERKRKRKVIPSINRHQSQSNYIRGFGDKYWE